MATTFAGHGNQAVQVGNSSGTITNTIHVHSQTAAASPNYKLGLSLTGAPQIDDELFVGRETEVAQLERYLSHTPAKQNTVALWGLGGIGKTQLSIHFAKRHQDRYSSII